jgi:hypothetical protein
MEESNLQNQSGEPRPAGLRPGPSGWRIALGVLVSIATLGVTLVLGFLSLCFGLLMSSSSNTGSSDRAFIYGLFSATVLVPIGGTWLAVYLFRGPKRSRTAVLGMPTAASGSVPVVVASVTAKEVEERIVHLRIVVLVAILADAALLVLNLSRYPGTAYHMPLAPIIVSFVLYELPYVIALVGLRNRGERWALSLALVYPILELCFTAFSFLTILAPLRSGTAIGGELLLHYVVGVAIDLAVVIFAWRAWQAARRGDDAVQLTVWGAASAFYLLVLHFITPFLHRLVHF